MKLRILGSLGHRTRDINLRHTFAIGPLCDTYLFKHQARLYYCTRCSWSFLVSSSAVAVVDAEGRPLTGEEAELQFKSFEDGPCPVLQGLAQETAALEAAFLRPSRNGSNNGLDDQVINRERDVAPRAGLRAWLRTPGSHLKDFRWQA